MSKKYLFVAIIMGFLILAQNSYVLAAESNHINRTIMVDKTVPLQATLTGLPAGWVNTDVQITVGNTIDPISNGVSSGVKQVDYEVDGVLQSNPGSGDCKITVTEEGTHNVVVRVLDMVGHTGPDATAVIRIDRTPPEISVSGVEDKKVYYGAVSPIFSATDAGSGLTDCSATLKKDTASPIPFTSGMVINEPGNYTLIVTASDKALNTVSQALQFDLTCPVAPAQPTATATSLHSIKVEWNPVDGAIGYLIMEEGTQIADVVSGTTYIHEGLNPNSRHKYTITAYNAFGNSPASPETGVFTLANEASNLQVTGKSSSSLTVSWEGNGNPAGTEYCISISDEAGYVNDVPFAADMFTYEFTGLSLGKEYTITVKARNGDQKATIGVSITAATNKAPVLVISEPMEKSVYSGVEGHRIIKVGGTVTDDDDDNVTVTVTINGISKSELINNCAGGKPFALTFDVVNDNIPEGSHVVDVVADDGK